MKTARIIAASFLCATAFTQAAAVSKLAAEWLVPSASTHNQLSLVDSATGTVRTAVMGGDGSVIWRPTISTGVTDVSDVAGGLAAASGEAIAITSPYANRVMLVNVDASSPVAREMPGLAGVGPCGISATFSPGAAGCMIVSSQNGGALFGRMESHENLATTAAVTAQSGVASDFRRLQPLADPLSALSLVAFYTANSGSNTMTGLLVRSGASVFRYPKNFHSGVIEFIPGVSDVNGAAGLPLVLGYGAGTTSARIVRVNTPFLSSAFTNTVLTYPFAVSGVIPVLDGGAGPLTDGFIAIAADGSEARWIRINDTGTAFIATGETFAATPGSAISGLVVVPGIGVMKLEGQSAGGPSTTFKAYQRDGGSWVETASGNLPEIPAAGRSFASLLFFDQDPATDEAARLLGIQALPDWTRPLAYPAPLPASVNQETFVSPSAGLTVSGIQTVSPPHGTTFVMANQVEPGLSVMSLGAADVLFSPELQIDPPSGVCSASIQVTALYDDERMELFWRDENAGSWIPWTGPLPVAYTRSLQFSLLPLAAGSMGPIVRRSYTFAAATLADQDSDHDGVPDYVEAHYSLDPFGGADHDGDGWSDLDELLNGTNPDDAGDYPDPGDSANVLINGGFRIAAIARTHSSSEIRNGEEMSAHGLDGALLDREAVASFGVTLPDGGTRGALLTSDTAVPFNELVALSSPLYFNINTGTRIGRELRAFIDSPAPPAFDPVFTPAGTAPAADAAGWVAAAQSAAAALPLAPGRTIIAPADTAVAVLLEDLVQRALAAVRPIENPAPVLDGFTIFPDREIDRTRTPLSVDDMDLLQSAGFDFRLALSLATTARSGMISSSNSLYFRHTTVSAATPAMLMPLDAIRAMFRGGTAPGGYVGAVGSTDLTNARNAYNTAITNASQTFRPVETWTVEVQETPSSPGVYQRTSDAAEVLLLNASGERFRLEQGLGLQPGTRFQITGFTDTPDMESYDTIEVIAASLVFTPEASDHDADGNLLDDEWERFFFGATGQDPFFTPGATDHTLLQYFLDGLDPRGNEVPTMAAVSLSPQKPIFTPATAGAFTLDFTFPSAYQDRFGFVLEKSTTLAPMSFGEIIGATVSSLGGDRLRMNVPASAAATPKGFFRVRVRLR